MDSNFVKQSRTLANRLRHREDLIDRRGWASVDAICRVCNIEMSLLERLVYNDDKGRYEFSDDMLSVRALYGHSVDVDLGLSPSIPPMPLYHGTAEKYLNAILFEGLQPRSRNSVHLSESVEQATSVGARHGVPIVLQIDTEAMMRDGFKFYRTKNGIWLTDNVPSQYILECQMK